MYEVKEVLDFGEVELIDYMGDDYRVLQTARVSTGGEARKGDKKDKGLIRYLYKNKHLTPFESVVFTFRVKCPIFVARQWMRHRTTSFNEFSGRYSEMPDEYYLPLPEEVYSQSTENHQGRSVPMSEYISMEESSIISNALFNHMDYSNILYRDLLSKGVAKEQARIILPVSQYTQFYATVNLRNLFHFLSLRLDAHAQYEIRVFAEAILEVLNGIEELKWSVAAFEEFRELEDAFNEAVNKAKTDTNRLLQELKEFTKGDFK